MLNFIEEADRKRWEAILEVNNYYREIVLKSILPKYLDKNHKHYKKAIDWIMQDWGGIKTGSKISTEHKNLKNCKESNFLPFERVASFSKPAAFMAPEKWAHIFKRDLLKDKK